MALARWLPAPAFRALGTIAGSAGWLVAGARRRIVETNVQHLADTMPPDKRHTSARRLFRRLFEDTTDLFRLPSMNRDAILALARTEGLDELRRVHAEGRGVV